MKGWYSDRSSGSNSLSLERERGFIPVKGILFCDKNGLYEIHHCLCCIIMFLMFLMVSDDAVCLVLYFVCLNRRICIGIFGEGCLCSEGRHLILKHILFFSCLEIYFHCAKSNAGHFALLSVGEDSECGGA